MTKPLHAELIEAAVSAPSVSFKSIVQAADAIHEDDLFTVVTMLTAMLCDDSDEPQRSRCLRVAVMLGAVLHRFIFEKHGIERHPDTSL